MGISSLYGVIAVTLLSAAPDSSKLGIPDLIPDDAAAALAIRSRLQLEKKGARFIADSGLPLPENQRPSSWFKQLFRDVEKGVDEDRPAAVILPNLRKIGHEKFDLEALNFLVYVVPFTDLDQVAANFGFKAGELKPGVLKTADAGRVVFVKEKHLFFGASEKAVANVVESKPVGGALSPSQKTSLERADIALHLTPESWGTLWKSPVDDLERWMRRGDDPAAGEDVDLVVAALRDLHSVTAGLRVDDGLALDVVVAFKKTKDGAGRQLLSALGSGTGAAELTGLPAMDPLFAYAARGDAGKNVRVVRPLLRIFLDFFPGLRQGVAAEVQRTLFRLFEGWYERLKGSRAVLYRADPRKAGAVGALGVVGILDTDDPDGLIASWDKLTKGAIALNLGLARPKLTFTANAEKIDENRVDILTFTFDDIGKEDQARLKLLLGPDWNRMRLSTEGKAVVWMVGSDTGAMRQALRNLRTGGRGLADHKAVAAAGGRLAQARKLEIRFGMKDLAALRGGPAKAPPGPVEVLTSVAVSVEPESIQVEVWVPMAEIRSLLAGAG